LIAKVDLERIGIGRWSSIEIAGAVNVTGFWIDQRIVVRRLISRSTTGPSVNGVLPLGTQTLRTTAKRITAPGAPDLRYVRYPQNCSRKRSYGNLTRMPFLSWGKRVVRLERKTGRFTEITTAARKGLGTA